MMKNRVEPRHHDGHGLNDRIEIYADDRDNNGASHAYRIVIDITGSRLAIESGCTGKTDEPVARIQFQHGPRELDESTPGCTEAALYAVLIDRLESFQEGPFACHENAQQLEHLYAALALTKARADERASRGVLGKNET
jgi:hypothetical protein